ncbi:MAG: glutamate--tRNA ligase [Bacteroidales bacterium]|nr:glutamate--tRNA ligase [Bacteroidales bacterium]
MERRTRVRFAPSPTGPLHMGGVRTALYNYLYAKQNGGDFIIRIEDTDSNRFVPGAEEYIIEALTWCGIIPDEGVGSDGKVVETPSPRHPHAPYRQSQRKPIYRKYAEQLIRNGYAYYAFDSAEELAEARAKAEASKETFIYNQVSRMSMRNSLTLPEDEVDRLLEETSDWTIRFKMPGNTVVRMDDLIRGHIEVNTDTLDDKVLWKRADELPTYHLANIVDDHLMEISEVIRGEEWLPSLPLHYMLYKAFGWEDTMPRFAHLSLLLKPVGNGKLSKRDGDKMGFPVFPLRWTNSEGETSRGYREDGYFPEAFVNLLAMLGWNPGDDREMFSMEELIGAFSLDKVQKAGAKFNPDKAKWYNREYLRLKTDEELTGLLVPVLEENGVNVVDCPKCALTAGAEFNVAGGDLGNHIFTKDYVQSVVAFTKERATFVKDFWDIAHYLFTAPETYVQKDVDKFWKPENVELVLKVGDFIKSFDGEWTVENVGTAVEEYIKSNEWPMGKVMNAFRLALAGSASGLGIADIVYRIGKKETVERILRLADSSPRSE